MSRCNLLAVQFVDNRREYRTKTRVRMWRRPAGHDPWAAGHHRLCWVGVL